VKIVGPALAAPQRNPIRPAAAAAANAGPARLASGRATTLSRSTESPESPAVAPAADVGAADGAAPPSRSASRLLANWPIRLVDTSASTPRPNCAALPEMVRSVVMKTVVASPSSFNCAVTTAAAFPLPRVSLPLALSTTLWAAGSFS
jgi:hypothetical protein